MKLTVMLKAEYDALDEEVLELKSAPIDLMQDNLAGMYDYVRDEGEIVILNNKNQQLWPRT